MVPLFSAHFCGSNICPVSQYLQLLPPTLYIFLRRINVGLCRPTRAARDAKCLEHLENRPFQPVARSQTLRKKLTSNFFGEAPTCKITIFTDSEQNTLTVSKKKTQKFKNARPQNPHQPKQKKSPSIKEHNTLLNAIKIKVTAAPTYMNYTAMCQTNLQPSCKTEA